MPQGRSAIPAELRRAVLVEAGHRCAIPTCRQIPVEIEHIDEWATVREHQFENLIALCPTCHARKGSGPGEIDRKALRQYKANLGILNGRYSDFERRFLEWCAIAERSSVVGPGVGVELPRGFELQMWNLLKDGMIRILGRPGTPMKLHMLTQAGAALVVEMTNAQPLEIRTWSDLEDQLDYIDYLESIYEGETFGPERAEDLS